jgi:hypothetical protein
MHRSRTSKSHTPRLTPRQEVDRIEQITADAMADGEYADGLENVRRARARCQAAVAADRESASLMARIRVAEAVLVAAVAAVEAPAS